MSKSYNLSIIIFLTLIFITLNACGKRGPLERPQLDGNLEPAEVEKNY